MYGLKIVTDSAHKNLAQPRTHGIVDDARAPRPAHPDGARERTSAPALRGARRRRPTPTSGLNRRRVASSDSGVRRVEE